MTTEVIENPTAGRSEVVVDGTVAGYADRTIDDGVMVLPHTVVDQRFRGRGLAGQLVRHALDDARAQGLSVSPLCWYVAQYIDDHPADQDLLAP